MTEAWSPAVISAALDDAGLSAAEFRVLCAVCRRAGDGANGRGCDASVGTLAKTCRLKGDTVRNALRDLVKAGWLEMTERPGKTSGYLPRFPDPSRMGVGVEMAKTPIGVFAESGSAVPSPLEPLPFRGRGESAGPLPFEAPTPKREPSRLGVGHPSAKTGGDPSRLGGDEGIPEGKPIREKRTAAADRFLVEIPLELSSAAFAAAWADWETHRREIKKPLKPTSAKGQLGMLAAWGEARAIAAIRHTIAMGWQGIREPEQRALVPTSSGGPAPARFKAPDPKFFAET